MISTDTCTFTREQKAMWEGDWTKIPMGMPGLETLLPLTYTHGVLGGRLSLEEMCMKLSTNPAKIMGLYPRKGAIAGRRGRGHRDHSPDARRTRSIRRRWRRTRTGRRSRGGIWRASRARRCRAARSSWTTTGRWARKGAGSGSRARAARRQRADACMRARRLDRRRVRRSRSTRCTLRLTSAARQTRRRCREQSALESRPRADRRPSAAPGRPTTSRRSGSA